MSKKNKTTLKELLLLLLVIVLVVLGGIGERGYYVLSSEPFLLFFGLVFIHLHRKEGSKWR